MIWFSYFFVGAITPNHPSLLNDSSISIQLAADGSVCGEAASQIGDLKSGIWEIKSEFLAPEGSKELTLAVVSKRHDLESQLVYTSLTTQKIFSRINEHPEGYEFSIRDSRSGIPVILTCFISVSMPSIRRDLSTNAINDGELAIHPIRDNTQEVTGTGDLHNYQEKFGDATLENAVSKHEEAVSIASHAHPMRAVHLIHIGMALMEQFEARKNPPDIDKAISICEEALLLLDSHSSKRPALLVLLAGYYDSRFSLSYTVSDQDRAISLLQEVVTSTLGSHSINPSTLNSLGNMYLERFKRFGMLETLDNGVSILKRGIELAGHNHRMKAALLGNLGSAYIRSFERFGRLEDLEMAVSSLQTAENLTPDGHPSKPGRFKNLGAVFLTLFQRLGRLEDLEKAVSSFQTAENLTPDGHPNKLRCFISIGNAFQTRFKRLGMLEDLEKAMSSFQTAANLAPDRHPDKPACFHDLGNIFQIRFERLGTLEDLEKAISSYQTAVNLTPDGNPNKPCHFNNLGSAFRARFERLGALEDLEKAISSGQTAVSLTPDGHPDKSGWLGNLGVSYMLAFERFGELEDLERAISSFRTATNLTPEGHPDKPLRFSNLGSAFQTRFRSRGTLEDLEKAISSLQTAHNLTPDGHPNKPQSFSSLGNVFSSRFKRLGNLEDLEGAISYLQSAVNLIPDGHPSKPMYLSNLGNAFHTRFKRLGTLEDLEKTISSFQTAENLTPAGHEAKAGRFDNIGNAFITRFEWFGMIEDFEKAISSLQTALNLTPDGHPDKPSRFNNLGLALERQFWQLGTLKHLESAISSLQTAVNLTPDDHVDKPGWLNNLGNAFQTRFKRLGTLEDLETAILNLQITVNLTPDDHPERTARFNNLGNAFRTRFERLKMPKDLENAILILQTAVNFTPDGHPNKPTCFSNLGKAYDRRYELLNDAKDLENALSSFSNSATSSTALPRVRFDAALFWAQLCKKRSQSPLPPYQCAIDLLPQITWLGVTVTDQYKLLAQVGGAVRNAVAAAIEAKQYKIAVEWAEQGRSIVWQNLLGLRTPVDDLRTTHSELAGRLQLVSKQIERSTTHSSILDVSRLDSMEDVARKHLQLAIERDNTIEEIRKIPEYKSFMKPKPFDELSMAAKEGPVVTLNVQRDRSDALILIPDGTNVSIRNVPLENFTFKSSIVLFEQLRGLSLSREVRASADGESGRIDILNDSSLKFNLILSLLWREVVRPVIKSLGYPVQKGHLPRIWWCPTGPLVFLPIHAAGIYDTDAVGQKLSDYVVSSYTPTLSAILKEALPVSPEKFKMLAVAQPNAPNASPIPETVNEVKRVSGVAGKLDVLELSGVGATVETVLEGMKTSNWVHLACHGTQNRENPLNSGLLLYNGTLKLSTIIKESLPLAEFAFLSACQTATADEKIAEESVHLAAGMLLAGYRGVIATMWSIGDQDAPQVAQDVYQRMLKDGRPNREEAAYALHEAVKRLREEKKANFISWVPFIHIGR